MRTLRNCMEEIFTSRKKDLKFFGAKALYAMNDMNIAEISFSTGGTCDRYMQLKVSIQNKTSGAIAENIFVFEDYLLRREDTSDSNVPYMFIWDDKSRHECGWYIVHPKSTEPIVVAIFEYIKMYS